MPENKTKQLFTEITAEDSSTINGGHSYHCNCYSYKKKSYYKSKYSYHPVYYTGSPRYCY